MAEGPGEMNEVPSIHYENRFGPEYEDSRGRSDRAFNQFASAVRNVYPEQFDGNLSIRRSYKTLRKIKDVITLRTQFQVLGMISIALGLISGAVSFGAGWSSFIANAQLGLSIVEYGLLAFGLSSVGYAEFGLRQEIRSRIEALEKVTTDNLIHRNLYFGSAQYSIRIGDEGLHYSANRLSAYISYWAVDIDKFIKDNGLPTIDVAPFRDARLGDVKSGRAEGEEFKEFFKALTDWFIDDPDRLVISVPLVTEGSYLHPKFREYDKQQKSSKKPVAAPEGPARLHSETLIIPLTPFRSNRDSDINPVEFTICLYFAIRRAHLDRIKMHVKKPEPDKSN